jgi:probable H4MPT-linked C1 transfer pathway protein
MPPTILGLDVGGANLKAATADRRAASVPFALWKQPDRLPAALGELVARFPDADELAVTMTGELCDCYETKRDGVNAILTAVQNVSRGRRIRVWSTDGAFADVEEARRNHLKVASANWHALATLAGQYVPQGSAILVDVGSTTTDVIPILDGMPIPRGLTDPARFRHSELLYTGVRRTPVCAVLADAVAAELFATTRDVYLLLERLPEDPSCADTADNRPATRACAFDRLCRMWCGDRETIEPARVRELADRVMERQVQLIRAAIWDTWSWISGQICRREGLTDLSLQGATAILAGSGEFLGGYAAQGEGHVREALSLTDRLGPEVSACAPAYAVAVLATEMPQPPGGRVTRGLWPWSGV